MKFITDANLGNLAKWLRILGFDTIYYRGNADRNFLRKAEREDRIVLTRKRDMMDRHYAGRLMLVKNDLVKNQIREVMDEFSLKPDSDSLFSICLKCNEKLRDIGRDEVAGMVPAYVYDNYSRFRICLRCRSIFWPGTHKDRVLDFLRKHNPDHLP